MYREVLIGYDYADFFHYLLRAIDCPKYSPNTLNIACPSQSGVTTPVSSMYSVTVVVKSRIKNLNPSGLLRVLEFVIQTTVQGE